jgi:hypothetical protein
MLWNDRDLRGTPWSVCSASYMVEQKRSVLAKALNAAWVMAMRIMSASG